MYCMRSNSHDPKDFFFFFFLSFQSFPKNKKSQVTFRLDKQFHINIFLLQMLIRLLFPYKKATTYERMTILTNFEKNMDHHHMLEFFLRDQIKTS